MSELHKALKRHSIYLSSPMLRYLGLSRDEENIKPLEGEIIAKAAIASRDEIMRYMNLSWVHPRAAALLRETIATKGLH